MEREMAKQSSPGDRLIDRRTVLQVGVALATAGPVLLHRTPDDPGLDRICRAAASQDVPVNLLCSGNLDAGTTLIDRHPETRFVVDHLGLVQPSVPPAP